MPLHLVGLACDELERQLEDPDPKVRLDACITILTLAKFGEADLEERVNCCTRLRQSR